MCRVLASDHQGVSEVGDDAKRWNARYGVVGIAGLNDAWFIDAMNTEGLTGHMLYMSGHATYAAAKHDGSDISILELLAFILGTCTTIDDVIAALGTVNVVDHQPDEVKVPGTVLEDTPVGPLPLLTKWSTVANVTGGRYLYNTMNDPQWYAIDVAATDVSTTRRVPFTTSGTFTAALL